MDPPAAPDADSAQALTPPEMRFCVVGIGASAGGLAATLGLLRELGATPGIAIVVVHHLDPTRESGLVEIFARAAQLSVQAAQHGARLEPNNVYVISPNTELLVVDGALHVTSRLAHGLSLPIDRFFESLASDCGTRAVGVLLSGTGSDGAEGISAIKLAGGATLVQDSSAEYRSMPESALATDHVDFVLPVKAIARELVRLGAHSHRSSTLAGDACDQLELRQVLTALRKATGVDFANYKHTTVRRRLERRLMLHGIGKLSDYVEFLQRTPDEARLLCEEILIHVTNFFRDPETFEVLRVAVFPRLLENRARDIGIRVWVPGCSTGEEVYSLAIGLLEFLADVGATDVPVKVFGTDVSAGAIERARAGKYPMSIEADVSHARLDRFFVALEGAYQIRKSVRDLCVFAAHDITRDPPFSKMDLVSCRNVLIYFGPVLQDRILPVLHYSLKEPGFLLLGASETIRTFPGFVGFDLSQKNYMRTSAAPRLHAHFGDSRTEVSRPISVSITPKPSGALDIQREADRILLAEFAPPGVVVTEDLAIVQFRGKTGPFLEPTPGVASFDLLHMVREELRLPLRQGIDEARSAHGVVRIKRLRVGPSSTSSDLEIEIIPFGVASMAQRFFVVLFTATPSPAAPASLALAEAPAEPPALPSIETQLRQELAATRHYLQSVIEQLEASNEELKVANEEIVSSNEELQSTNEELQMAKEELEATNEELRTVNDEMTVRNLEGMRLNDDLTNLLNSIEIPVLIIGRDSRLRRFTPAAARLFQLTAHDIGGIVRNGHPIGFVPNLEAMLHEVLDSLSVRNCVLQDERGRWQQLTVRPYITTDKHIDGTVISVFDIDSVKKAEKILIEGRAYAESILDTVRECLVVLDRNLCVQSVNRTFQATFGVDNAATFGRPFYELGTGEWNIPALREQLTQLGEGDKIEDFSVDLELSNPGPRAFVLNARRIEHRPLILLAIEDVTLAKCAAAAARRLEIEFRERTEQQLHDYQERLQYMVFDAALAEERERRRIAADLHDRIGQSLALAQIKLTSTRDAASGPLHVSLDEAVELLAQCVVDTRTLTFDLSPPVLYDLGIQDALSWLAEDVEKRHGVHIDLDGYLAKKALDDVTAALVFRAVRELIINVIKHAQVSRARVFVQQVGNQLEVAVDDAGVGFDLEELRSRRGAGSFGLFSVREKITRLGGTVHVLSTPGHGTRVRVRVPLTRHESASTHGSEALP